MLSEDLEKLSEDREDLIDDQEMLNEDLDKLSEDQERLSEDQEKMRVWRSYFLEFVGGGCCEGGGTHKSRLGG